ncbi:MAG TPA: hypothetical protein VIV60_29515 [Polyangiaceae bacterium]
MTHRQLLRILASLFVVTIALPAVAAYKDAVSLKKLDEALGVHYLAAEYDKAESVLRAALANCGTKACSGEVIAKLYIAVGVVRGNTKQDIAGAHAAFESAKAADPNATLDAALATPKVLTEFYKVMERELPPDAMRQAEGGEEAKDKGLPRVSPAGDLRCTPASGYEIPTATPIAVVCEPLEGVVRAELHYRVAGEQAYSAILMSVEEGTLRAHIPCEALTKPGKLDVYIVAQDFNKEMIDTFGNMATPAHYMLVPTTKQPVPSYPGKAPPQRCTELLNGAAAAGQSCSDTVRCRSGLYCAEGSCRQAPACETNSDCESNQCSNGFCAMDVESNDSKQEPKRWMLGLHGGFDFWMAPSAKQVCGRESAIDGTYNCYNAGEDKVYITPPRQNSIPMTDDGAGGNVSAGFRPATIRLMLSIDRVLTRYVSVGGRVGWALNGGPRTIKYTEGYPRQHRPFMPAHVEARGTLWLRSLAKPGLHPYFHLGGGVAEVDAKVEIKGTYRGTARRFDAWRKMGMFFVAGGGGALATFGRSRTHGVQLNINLMYMLPATGIIIEPSAGYALSF